MPLSDPMHLTITELSARIRRREISIREIVKLCLDRIEALNTHVNAFVSRVEAEEVLKTAEQQDLLISRGQRVGHLHGIPFAIKDNCWTTDFPTTACSPIMKKYRPPMDATVVSRLRGAGAIILGKTNMHEWAYGATNEKSLFGAVRNPWNDKHISGGSSGGSGAAVACGMALAAIGSDTAGSVRIPSAACGISGMKPSYGTVSRYGVFPLSWSFDAIGPMARCADDLSLILGIISGRDDKDATCTSAYSYTPACAKQNFKGIRLAVPVGNFFKRAPEVDSVFKTAIGEITKDGAVIEEVEIPRIAEAYTAWSIIEGAEASTYHAGFMEKSADLYSSGIRVQLEVGRCISAVEYLRAQQYQTLFNRQLDDMFSRFDALVLPTLSVVPPLIGAGKLLLGGKEMSSQEAMIHVTWIANLGGLPAVTIPCGFEDGGLPVGLMIMGKKYADSEILALASRYQLLTRWHEKSCLPSLLK